MRKQAAPSAASPERSRPWSNPTPPPPSPKHHPSRRIPVVYYLCRNRHLEHPHFIEVPLSSPNGLYLRDVINRLITLRGKSMPAMYSWSCKRSYKSGFVWHDLSEDDLIVPSQGNEYVLKGSELLDQSPPDRSSVLRTQEPAPEPQPQPQEAVNSQHPCSSSDDSTRPETSSPGPVEYRVYKPHCATDASTQTEDAGGGRRTSGSPNMCVRGVSTDEGSSQDRNEISSTPSSTSSSGKTAQTATLESLIRAEASKMNSFRILEGQEEVLMPAAAAKLKATDMLIQLITCGSISVKDHGSFGLVPTYLPRFSRVRFPSPMFAGSMAMVEELDCLSENPRMVGLRMEDKEDFSGSLIESWHTRKTYGKRY